MGVLRSNTAQRLQRSRSDARRALTYSWKRLAVTLKKGVRLCGAVGGTPLLARRPLPAGRSLESAQAWSRAREVPITEIAARLNLKIVRRFVSCFGHNDSTPSLHLNIQSNRWKCFGCNKGGSTIDLVSNYLGMPPKDAVAWILASESAAAFPLKRKRVVANSAQYIASPKVIDPEVLGWLMSESPLVASGRDYLRNRGFDDRTIEKFQIGQLNDAAWLTKRALSKWGAHRLHAAGLLVGTSVASRLIFETESILFPFFTSGATTYLQGRSIAGAGADRWRNLVGVSKPLYNASALEGARGGTVHLCEGVTDTIAADQLGLRAVGVLGATSLTPHQASLFEGKSVVLLPDGDGGGQKFVELARSAFKNWNVHLVIRRLPLGHDVASMLLANKPRSKK